MCNTDLKLQGHHPKGTASIKMREVDPSHVKETSCTCSLVINGIQTKAACSFRIFERLCLRQCRLCSERRLR